MTEPRYDENDLIAAMTAVIEQHHPSPDHVLGQTPAIEIARELLPVVRMATDPEPGPDVMVSAIPHLDRVHTAILRNPVGGMLARSLMATFANPRMPGWSVRAATTVAEWAIAVPYGEITRARAELPQEDR